MSFKHLTANGSVDWGQRKRATVWGRGMANLVPTYPSEGKGARVACAPCTRHRGGGGDRNREPGEMGCFGRARGGRPRRLSVSVGRGMRELRSWQLWR